MKTVLLVLTLMSITVGADAQDGPTEDCAESTDNIIRTHDKLDDEMQAIKRTGDIYDEVLLYAADEFAFWLSEGYWRCHDQDVGLLRVTPLHLYDAFEFKLWLHNALSGCDSARGCDAFWR